MGGGEGGGILDLFTPNLYYVIYNIIMFLVFFMGYHSCFFSSLFFIISCCIFFYHSCRCLESEKTLHCKKQKKCNGLTFHILQVLFPELLIGSVFSKDSFSSFLGYVIVFQNF